MIRRNCEICGKFFYVKIASIERITCSKKCWRLLSGKNQKNGEKVNCLYCGKKFYVSKSYIDEGRGKYCQESCYNKHRGGKYVACDNCGIEVYKKPNKLKKNNNNFCSSECYHEYRTIYPRTGKIRRIIKQRWGRENLNDSYVKSTLTRSIDLKFSKIPIQLVGLKRQQLKLKREIRKAKS